MRLWIHIKGRLLPIPTPPLCPGMTISHCLLRPPAAPPCSSTVETTLPCVLLRKAQSGALYGRDDLTLCFTEESSVRSSPQPICNQTPCFLPQDKLLCAHLWPSGLLDLPLPPTPSCSCNDLFSTASSGFLSLLDNFQQHSKMLLYLHIE